MATTFPQSLLYIFGGIVAPSIGSIANLPPDHWVVDMVHDQRPWQQVREILLHCPLPTNVSLSVQLVRMQHLQRNQELVAPLPTNPTISSAILVFCMLQLPGSYAGISIPHHRDPRAVALQQLQDWRHQLWLKMVQINYDLGLDYRIRWDYIHTCGYRIRFEVS